MLRIKTKERINCILDLLLQIHGNGITGQGEPDAAVLSDCQQAAIAVGESLERELPDEPDLVRAMEEYCEIVYRFSQGQQNREELLSRMNELIGSVKEKVEQTAPVREIAFFPYKASMWDSLESVYLAAKEDPECEVYCVPIPYYDKNEDQGFGTMHYEGNDFPSDVKITDWKSYDFEERRPEVIYIHNPYDEYNRVTSVHPLYYSANLKKYTDTLVYIPYYSTAGGMAEGQRLCSAYMNADYIVIQSPEFRKYFDEKIPDEKFLPLGSPKFDRIIHKCQNPPKPPIEWKEQMAGRKVYFYNTSLNGMLADTGSFLKKMEYVFHCFEGRTDACLLWRPHPLFESTLDSMRPAFKPEYERIKSLFFEKKIGIYDTTPDIEDTIALCDAYIGDAASSVMSLFGIVGKSVFLLNNQIHGEPDGEDWKREIGFQFNLWGEKEKWVIAQGNKLYAAEKGDYHYRYYCDLSERAYGGEYRRVVEIGDRLYAVPRNALDIVVIRERKIVKRVKLEPYIDRMDAFCNLVIYSERLVCIPVKYPYLVVYDTRTDKVSYYEGFREIYVSSDQGQVRTGGVFLAENRLYFASPVDARVGVLDLDSGEVKHMQLPLHGWKGCLGICGNGEDLWLLPVEGLILVRWNPQTGEVRQYEDFPEGFACADPIYGERTAKNPFGSAVFWDKYMYITPLWGNMFLRMDVRTGEISQWKLPLPKGFGGKIFHKEAAGFFRASLPGEKNGNTFEYFSWTRLKLYEINVEKETGWEISLTFDKEELRRHEPGFAECFRGAPYACCENAFNSLTDFLDGKITGAPYDRDRQLAAYRKVAANNDGTCGQRVHERIRKACKGDL